MIERVGITLVWITLLLNAAIALTDIAESSAKKTVVFADDMNNALECAYAGVALDVCSPNLQSTDFKKDIKEYNKEIYDLNQDLLAYKQNQGLIE